ncbi:hypothetical protein HW932_01960 [Allochromatium humboldtianum]|uniref:Uncharacterized protein n=1 Tax=Allochromatium humboldtianum TaxID=504901 RepID=A0A850R321_9GAMM|nr:hypothetical protein [Allochromatium humboldtianum]NVZ08024.1 hypothetical protein [Allochromatium humboldtianum]
MNVLLSQLVGTLITQLAPNVARAAVKAILDVVEQAILDSQTKTDDAILLPIIRAIRETYELERD